MILKLTKDIQEEFPGVEGFSRRNILGLILCKRKSKIKAEYALREINKLMSVAEYSTEAKRKLQKSFDTLLPAVEEIEAELEKD